MKKKSRLPSFSKIITTDYPAFLASISPIVIFLLFLVFLIVQRRVAIPIPPQVASVILFTLIGITLMLVLYQLYRVWLIRRVFQRGSDVQGRISSIKFRRLGGWIGYTFSFGQKRITSGAPLRLNSHTKALHKGERTLIVVDRNNPKRAFIRDLYR